jgi:replicative DNA helicase
MVGEREARIEAGKRALSFGVRFLDNAMGGIMPNDLLLLGAKSGVGKTALATIISLHNCAMGKRVHYFALEAEELEIERRMKFQVLASEYYRARFQPPPIRYLDWAMGRIDHLTGPYEEQAEQLLRDRLSNLHTFYRFNSFTGDDFCKRLDAIKDETDLVVLDHLHYVDHEGDENQGYKQTVKKIRDSALRVGKPVLVVAHVRKGDRRNDTPVPTLEDFHGTSDVPKISTKAIMLAPAFEVEGARPYRLPTYMQVVKCRPDASVTRFAAQVTFNARENKYEPEYGLGRFHDGGFQVLSADQMPPWARAKRYDE